MLDSNSADLHYRNEGINLFITPIPTGPPVTTPYEIQYVRHDCGILYIDDKLQFDSLSVSLKNINCQDATFKFTIRSKVQILCDDEVIDEILNCDYQAGAQFSVSPSSSVNVEFTLGPETYTVRKSGNYTIR
jgi:hypothetical protein